MIPRKLHAFWDGPAMPDAYARFLNRWQALHPEWEFGLWNVDSFAAYCKAVSPLNVDYFMRPEHWSPKSNEWQWRADIARYIILWEQGGVWIDCDLEPIKPIDALIEPQREAFLAYEDYRHRYVNNAFMGAAPGGVLMNEIMQRLGNRVEAHTHVRVNRSIGAHFLTGLVQRPGVREHVTLLDHDLVYPYHWSQLHKSMNDYPGSYTVHHWGNMRTLKRQPLGT